MLERSDLHDYQTDQAIPHIWNNERCAVWCDVGGGKSVITLTALDELAMVEDDVWPTLVLGTKRIARSVWPQEPSEWEHLAHLKVSAIVGTPDERRAALRRKAHIYTCNYENLGWLVDVLGADWPFKTVVADECTKLKGCRTEQGSKNAGALRDVVIGGKRGARALSGKVRRMIHLSGTPAPNGLKDLWGQMYLLDAGQRLGTSFDAFEQRWFRRGYDGWGLEPMPHAEREIHERLRDICLTVDVPPVEAPVANDIYVDLPREARAAYAKMEKEMFAEIEEVGVEAFNAAAKSSKCEQIANGAVYYDDEKNWKKVHDAKIEALEDVIEESNGAPVLVGYQFKHDLACLQKAFPKGVTLDDKTSTIDRWNDGAIPILFAHPACLHPSTEVLTENRGWVTIVEVRDDERVFDGEEFVSHRGCSFSGIRPVINCFGLTLTPDHKLLVGDRWVKAKHVRNCEASRRAAAYTYTGVEARIGAMLSMHDRTRDASPECRASKPNSAEALSVVPGDDVSSHDWDPVLVDLAAHEGQSDRPKKSGLSEIRGSRSWHFGRLAFVQQFLSRHVFNLSGWAHHRARGQFARLLKRELSVGDQLGAAVKQEQQPRADLPRARDALGRILPRGRCHSWSHLAKTQRGNEPRGGFSRLRSVVVSTPPAVAASEEAISEVYDLVDCGPRHRFVVRNAEGEVFISHNSAGHGLNMARGGHILARLGFDWNLEHYDQIIGRIGPRRQKQAGLDRRVYDHRILARKTIDEDKRERVISKRSTQDILKDAMRRYRG